MARHVSRRSFLRASALAGTAAIAGDALGGVLTRALGATALNKPADMAVVSGSNFYDATVRAIELLGGIERFVPRNARVGLLVNSRYSNPGTYVKPEITLAVIALCHRAGALQLISLEDTSARYWRHATVSPEHQRYLDTLTSPRAHRTTVIHGGRNVKTVDVVPDLLDCDVFVNLPIFKDHAGAWFTGALKNIMGAIADRSNQRFHQNADSGEDRDGYAFLSQSIADANLLRRPTLVVGDATEVLVRRGPYGPGPVRKYNTVVAATDPVALDACGAGILGIPPEQLATLRKAQEHGIGTMNLESLTIVRESL